MAWELFWSFLKIGFISFGGGFAMIPVIQHEVMAQGWMSEAQYSEVVAVAGMAPGPIATNIAIEIGYQTAGFGGSVLAAMGMTLPSVIVILLISLFFQKWYEHKEIKSVFYGLRPVITALIFYAAVRLALANPLLYDTFWNALVAGLIFLIAFAGVARYKMHPLAVILLSGLIGIAVYS